MALVTSKLEERVVDDPLNRSPDPWMDFREIEIVALEWTQRYRHSLGKYSRFFLGLERGTFLATRCDACSVTWAPPRPACPRCLQPTRWVELNGRGKLVSWSILHYSPKMLADVLSTPYILAYVKLDGADTLFAHLLDHTGPLTDLRYGLPIAVAYEKTPVTHPIMLMRFVSQQV